MGIIIIKNMQAYGAPYAGYGYGGWAAGVDANNAAVDFSHASAASSDARFAALNTANYDSRVASRTESPGRSAMREPRTKRVPSLVAADLSATTTPFFGQSCSVDPLGEEIAGRQLRRHLGRGHPCVLTEVLGALPFEELDAVLRVRLAAKMTVSGGLLILH